MIGRSLGRYRIVEEIRRGGMGAVFRAMDTKLNREVAIKVLPPELMADADRKRRFLQEAQTASQLENPHVGVIYEVDEIDGVSFIAMELIRGYPLNDDLVRGPLPMMRSLEIAGEIAEGLAHAHDKGVIHRDLKPGNVMVTPQGHAKIIDFGLAKLVETLGSAGDADTVQALATEPGVVMGTTAYMSPEQAAGRRVDYRSDIFSFGVVLYQMVSGRLPFSGPSSVDTMHAILHAPAPSLADVTPGLPAETVGDLERLLAKCLEKDPEARYQGMRDVIVDLRAVRRHMDSGAVSGALSASAPNAAMGVASSAPHVVSRRIPVAVIAATAIAIAAAVVLWSYFGRREGAITSDRSKPSIAVMYFQNHTGNAQLDWLKTGLTDMLVTDLSQSADVEVLSTDRLYQILRELNRHNDPVLSFETVQQVARRAGVDSVLIGNYVKAGETIRINVTLQDTADGRILSSERVDATGESNLFPTVDDLTRRLRTSFALPVTKTANRTLIDPPGASASSGMFRNLSEVTTSSAEAYRFYAQGIDLHQRGREEEAVPLFEKALNIDPEFALALTKLAVVEHNIGHWTRRDELAKRALEKADRLPPRERYYIEGFYYSHSDRTVGKAIDAYKKAIELYPDHQSASHNLAQTYSDLDRSADAIPIYERLRQRPDAFTFTFSNLATAYGEQGQYEKGRQALDEMIRRDPGNVTGYRQLAGYLVSWRKFDEAAAVLDKSDAIDGGTPGSARVRWNLLMLTGRVAEAATSARNRATSADTFVRWEGLLNHAQAALLSGRSAAALGFLEEAAKSQPPNPQTAIPRFLRAALLLDLDQPAPALVEAEKSFQQSNGMFASWASSYYRATALARLGRADDAETALAEVSSRADVLPGDREKRRVHWIRGLLAAEKRDNARAIEELRLAEAALSPRGLTGPPPPHHVPIWFDLASAYLASGDLAQAEQRFQRIVDSTEWLAFPVQYVRSFYFLGQIAEKRGDVPKARAFYQRFVDAWGGGDIDRARVAEARKKIG